MRDDKLIQSLVRGFRIIEILEKSSQPLTLTEIANFSKLNKTDTQRFLRTLCSLGYLNREETKRYFLGTKFLSMGLSFLNTFNRVMRVKPY